MTETLHIVLVSLALASATGASASPAISSVNGDMQQGSTITVSGSNFGTGPSGVVFDDFELGTDGNSIMTGSGSARVGQWDVTSGSNYYSNDHSVSGSLAFEANMGLDYLSYVRRNFPAGTSELFASWWVRIPDPMPGEGNPAGINWKHIWIQGSSSVDDDMYLVYYYDLPSTVSHIGGNTDVAPVWMWTYGTWHKGDWIRGWIYVKGGITDGHYDVSMLHENGTRQTWSVNGQTWGNDPTPYEYRSIRFNGYGRQTSGSYPVHDDCYSAYGSNCRARVEIGNASTYSSCTDLAICGPTSWSSSSVTAKCNVGGLSPADDWYMFVIDSSGSASTGYKVSGYELTVTNGSGSGDYEENDVVPISASAAPLGKAFAAWMGDYTYVADRMASSTTVTMPAADVSVTAAYAWVYELTVNSGTGDGQYFPAAVVDIQADPAPSGTEFAGWTGDVAYVADTESAATTVTMPSSAVEVTAGYASTAIPGDLNDDGWVGQPDLDIILDQWSCGEPPREPITDPRADANGDGWVGQPDLDIVLDHWGQSL